MSDRHDTAFAMISPPRISVVLPVYNHAAFLVHALEGLARQTVAPHEVIVVDDASSDDSATVAEAFAERIAPRFSVAVLRNPHNLGVNGTLNRGLAQVSGDWVACTAADDLLEPRFLESMGRAAQRFPQARLVTSALVEFFEAENRRLVHDDRSEMGPWYAGAEPEFLASSRYEALLGRGHIAIAVSASIIQTAALREAGGFDERLKWHADWFAAYAIAARYGLAVVPEPLAVFRVAAGTFSGDNVRHTERQREVCNAILAKLHEPAWHYFRASLRRAPSPFAPFVRHMLPALAVSPADRDMAIATACWWMREAMRGRRPGPLRRLATRLGIETTPRL